MIRYETHRNEIDQIFKLINSGRFYSLTFIKKGDGQLRYLNGHRATYKKPDGSEEMIRNVGYDPKNYNLIRVWDRNALNPRTNENTGNYRSAALENILYIKCGNKLFDFVEENDILYRFTNVTEEELNNIKAKMKIESTISEEINRLMRENYDSEQGQDLDKYFINKHYPQAKYEVPEVQNNNVSGELVANTKFSALRQLPKPINIYKNPRNLTGYQDNVRGIITDEGDLFLAQYTNTQHYNIIMALAEKGIIPHGFEKNYYRTLPDDFMCVQRDEDTNTFYSSTAYNNMFPNKYNDLLELASRTQPFDFEMEHFAVGEYDDYGYEDDEY